MARPSRSAAKAILTVGLACVLAWGAQTSPARSFPLALKAPSVSVPVATPTVTVKAPSLPVTTPTITVEAPTVRPAPSGPLRTLTVGVEPPAVSTSKATISAKAPSVRVGRTSGAGAIAGAQRATAGSAGSGAASSGGATGGPVTAPASPSGAIGPLGSYRRMPALQAPIRSHARARMAARERRLKATVARFAACLSVLGDEQRELLELRVGRGAARPLSPRATAARLHIGIARFARLQADAVRELRQAASTRDCGRLAMAVSAIASYLATSFDERSGAARAGVEAVRYDAPARKPTRAQGDGLLGAEVSPIPGGAISVLVFVLVAILAVTALIADAAGHGPRHEQWRRRMIGRLHSWR